MKLKNNKIIVHKLNGRTQEVLFVSGLSVRFKGENNTIELYEPFCFNKKFLRVASKIKISGDNNHIIIGASDKKFYSISIINVKNNNRINIGENLWQTGTLEIDFANESNKEFIVGNDCMFGQNVKFMLGDHHSILDSVSNEQLNIAQRGIILGDHVWLARDVKVLKDTSVAKNSVVAIGSVVTKNFDEENILIGGIPAKILKKGINWKR